MKRVESGEDRKRSEKTEELRRVTIKDVAAIKFDPVSLHPPPKEEKPEGGFVTKFLKKSGLEQIRQVMIASGVSPRKFFATICPT